VEAPNGVEAALGAALARHLRSQPAASGTMIDQHSLPISSPAASSTAPSTPRSCASTTGTVITPARLVNTVSSKARAMLPRAWVVSAMPDERVVGMQQNSTNPMRRASSSGSTPATPVPSTGVISRIDRLAHSVARQAPSAAQTWSVRSRRPAHTKMMLTATCWVGSRAMAWPGAGARMPTRAASSRPNGRFCCSRKRPSGCIAPRPRCADHRTPAHRQ